MATMTCKPDRDLNIDQMGKEYLGMDDRGQKKLERVAEQVLNIWKTGHEENDLTAKQEKKERKELQKKE